MDVKRTLGLPGAAVVFEVIHNPESLVADGFKRKFGSPPPATDWPHHVCALWSPEPGAWRLLGYGHFGRFGDTCLVGGMYTDGRVVRELPAEARQELSRSGGLAVHLLRFGFAHLGDRFDAFFGLVEDPRALEVDLAAGFVETEHDRLVMYLPKPLDPQHVRCLQAKVLALGDF